MKTVLVTGSTGFVGQVAVQRLRDDGWVVRSAVRGPTKAPEEFSVGAIGADTDWTQVLDGVDVVLHLAARTHRPGNTPADQQDYTITNVHGTEQLARQAVAAGVRRFVFCSSIKVNGEATPPDQPYRADDEPKPEDAYGISKHQAEEKLFEVCQGTAMEPVVVRPPLVYGPAVKANFLRLFGHVAKGRPLPLAAISNRRSIVYVENLVDLLVTCATHPAAANQRFLVADDGPLSTIELARGIATALNRKTRELALPPALLKLAATTVGRRAWFERLAGSLVVDTQKTKSVLEWNPPFRTHQGLKATADWYAGRDRRAPSS